MAFPTNAFVRHQVRPTPRGVIDLSGAGLGRYPIEAQLRDPQRLSGQGYHGSLLGLMELRQAIGDLYGVPVEEVAVTLGAAQANFMALSALTSPGDKVLLESPCYENFKGAIGGLGCEVVPFSRRPETGWLPDLNELEEGLKGGARVVMMSDPMNPSGVMMDEGDFDALAALCADFDAALLVDEIFQDFYHLSSTRSHRVGRPNVVATSSLSKVYGLGHLHLGWLLGPEALLDRAWDTQELSAGSVPMASQVLGLLALEEREVILEWALARLRPNLDALGRFQEVVPQLRWDGGLRACLAFPRLPDGVDGDGFAARLMEEAQVRVVPGRFFGMPQGMRVSLGAPLDDFRRGLSRIGRCLQGAL